MQSASNACRELGYIVCSRTLVRLCEPPPVQDVRHARQALKVSTKTPGHQVLQTRLILDANRYLRSSQKEWSSAGVAQCATDWLQNRDEMKPDRLHWDRFPPQVRLSTGTIWQMNEGL
ncbi:hypothetical protein VTN49DRAFT_6407 [Thermomyces lanuginosus]|uniref:uncharacterized protein n=1 Tax=Thermomyces lanuginosus TaxID=5541 RepID=UPI003744497F